MADSKWATQCRDPAQCSGRILQLSGGLIAGIAKANDLAVATRNVADFRSLDLEVVNPWDIP